MLVHVSRFVDQHQNIADKIKDDFFDDLKNEIETYAGKPVEKAVAYSDAIRDIREVYRMNFENHAEKFEDIMKQLINEVRKLNYIVNGRKGNTDLNKLYDERKNGASVIAVGGAKLSRGLTRKDLQCPIFQ